MAHALKSDHALHYEHHLSGILRTASRAHALSAHDLLAYSLGPHSTLDGHHSTWAHAMLAHALTSLLPHAASHTHFRPSVEVALFVASPVKGESSGKAIKPAERPSSDASTPDTGVGNMSPGGGVSLWSFWWGP